MSNEEREKLEREIATVKLEGEQLRNDRTRNMNALTLKVDVVASELKEGQEQLREGHRELTANVNQLVTTVSKLADFIKQVASLQIDQDARIRRLETLPPQTA
jgi:predicted transcriptional regulator